MFQTVDSVELRILKNFFISARWLESLGYSVH